MGKPPALVQALLAFLLTTASGCLGSDSRPTGCLGTSPFCAVSQRDCDVLGLTYVRSDTSGDGFSCLSGEKVLCEAPMIALKPAGLVDDVLPAIGPQRPVRAELEVGPLRAERKFAICVGARLRPFHVSPVTPACAKTLHVRDLSDHYPVIGRFEYAD